VGNSLAPLFAQSLNRYFATSLLCLLLGISSLVSAATFRVNFYKNASATPSETTSHLDWDDFQVSNNARNLTLKDKAGSNNASLAWGTGYSQPSNDQPANIPSEPILINLFNSYLHQGASDGGITISGLTPGESFSLKVYCDINQAAVDTQNRKGTLTVLGAISSLSWANLDGATTALITNDGSPNHPSNVLNFNGVVDASGTMTMRVNPATSRLGINGFELITTPSGDPPPNIVSFTSNTSTFQSGDTITLSWKSRNVTGTTSVSINQGIDNVAASGSTLTTPTTTTTYTLTAMNGSAPATAQVTVSLDRGPIQVYLLGGQSNMQGVARKSKLPAELLEIPEIILYHSTGVSSGQPANTWITLRPAGWNGTAGGDVTTRFAGYNTVRQAILDSDENSGAPLSVTNTSTVPTNSTNHPTHEQEQDEYRDTDEVHLIASAQLALGRSMADRLLKLNPISYSQWATQGSYTRERVLSR